MTQITTIGLDLAKKVLQVHGVDAEGKVVVARKLRRKEVLAFFAKLPPCLVGMEACGSAHFWAREIAKLGHTVKLMPPATHSRPRTRQCIAMQHSRCDDNCDVPRTCFRFGFPAHQAVTV